MSNTKEYDVTVGSGIISIFQRQSFKLERVFSEFIDNSLQSFIDHQDELKNLTDGRKCKVAIEWDSEKIIIRDNAYGMNDAEFGRALQLKAANPNAFKNNQLSVYGMGLKYAAVYLGDHYLISTTAYNSNTRYSAEVDVPTFEKDNPKTVNAKLSDDSLECHETSIKITNLRIKRTSYKENDLRDKLGIIYNHYIHDSTLSITVNSIPVKYQKPEIRKDDSGSPYYKNLANSFFVNGKTYNYSGWIALLDKGDQSITGLNLVQAKRCIELGYKPEKIFGKGNSFQNSRVFGEIVFNGENYVLSFNKDKFVWADDGAEDAFIESLSNNDDVKYILKMAKELSYKTDNDKVIAKTQKTLTANTSFSSIKPINKIEKEGEKTKDININETKSVPIETDKTEEHKLNEEKSKYTTYSVSIDDKDVLLYVDFCNGASSDDWITFDKYQDGYIVKINCDNNFINKNFKTQDSKASSNALAILLATSMLKAQKFGLKLSDSSKLLNVINEIMGEIDGK